MIEFRCVFVCCSGFRGKFISHVFARYRITLVLMCAHACICDFVFILLSSFRIYSSEFYVFGTFKCYWSQDMHILCAFAWIFWTAFSLNQQQKARPTIFFVYLHTKMKDGKLFTLVRAETTKNAHTHTHLQS